MSNLKVEGVTSVITGAASGMGAAVARNLAGRGAPVSYTHLTLPTILRV